MIQHVLIAVEDDRTRMEPVVDCAGEIAGALDADVTLFRAYDEEEFEDRLDAFEFESADPSELAKRNVTIRESAAALRERGLEASIVASVGDPAEEIARYVADNGVDHVFLGGRRRTATKKAILGSVSQSVLRSIEVPCTVLMERSDD